ncbi:hypothetical protein SAMN04487896_0545 [Paenibacillus sp. ov031]|nr:hypothetical protein SAMN04487896_0545 [Paenibacillus sp. ov031]
MVRTFAAGRSLCQGCVDRHLSDTFLIPMIIDRHLHGETQKGSVLTAFCYGTISEQTNAGMSYTREEKYAYHDMGLTQGMDCFSHWAITGTDMNSAMSGLIISSFYSLDDRSIRPELAEREYVRRIYLYPAAQCNPVQHQQVGYC